MLSNLFLLLFTLTFILAAEIFWNNIFQIVQLVTAVRSCGYTENFSSGKLSFLLESAFQEKKVLLVFANTSWFLKDKMTYLDFYSCCVISQNNKCSVGPHSSEGTAKKRVVEKKVFIDWIVSLKPPQWAKIFSFPSTPSITGSRFLKNFRTAKRNCFPGLSPEEYNIWYQEEHAVTHPTWAGFLGASQNVWEEKADISPWACPHPTAI